MRDPFTRDAIAELHCGYHAVRRASLLRETHLGAVSRLASPIDFASGARDYRRRVGLAWRIFAAAYG